MPVPAEAEGAQERMREVFDIKAAEGIAQVRSEAADDQRGKIEISFHSYLVNTGLKDGLFK